jgi:hypothetical protein
MSDAQNAAPAPAAPAPAAAAAPAPTVEAIPPPIDELAPIPRRPVMSADALRSVQETHRSVRVQRKSAESSTTSTTHQDWWDNVMRHAKDLNLDNIHEHVSHAAKVAAQEDQSYVSYELAFTRSRAAVTYRTCARDRGNSVHLDAAFDAIKVEFARRVFAKCGVRDVCAQIRQNMPGVKVELKSRLDPSEPVVLHISWKKEKKTVYGRVKKHIVDPVMRFLDTLPLPSIIF